MTQVAGRLPTRWAAGRTGRRVRGRQKWVVDRWWKWEVDHSLKWVGVGVWWKMVEEDLAWGTCHLLCCGAAQELAC